MGVGSFLKKWGLPIASIAAIPFTGGASALGLAGSTASRIGGILDTAGKIAPILGGAAAQRGQAKQVDASQQLSRDQIDQQGAEQRLRAPGAILGTGARAALAGSGPVKLNWGGPGSGLRGETLQSTGGFTSAASDPRLKQLADKVMQHSMEQDLGGGIPGATPAPQASFTDKALGAGGTIASILGALGTLRKKQPNQVMDDNTMWGPPEEPTEDYGMVNPGLLRPKF